MAFRNDRHHAGPSSLPRPEDIVEEVGVSQAGPRRNGSRRGSLEGAVWVLTRKGAAGPLPCLLAGHTAVSTATCSLRGLGAAGRRPRV